MISHLPIPFEILCSLGDRGHNHHDEPAGTRASSALEGVRPVPREGTEAGTPKCACSGAAPSPFTPTVRCTAVTLATAPLLSTGALKARSSSPGHPCPPHPSLTPKTRVPGIRVALSTAPPTTNASRFPTRGRPEPDPRGPCFGCECQTSCTDYQPGTERKRREWAGGEKHSLANPTRRAAGEAHSGF